MKNQRLAFILAYFVLNLIFGYHMEVYSANLFQEGIQQKSVGIETSSTSPLSSNLYVDQIHVSSEEAKILKKIAQAEANADGVEGKAMVMKVVLNRVESEIFPDNIKDVVFQSGQFSPINNGSYNRSTPDDECNQALYAVLTGEYSNVEALFFDNCKNSWASRNREYECSVGHHKFYK